MIPWHRTVICVLIFAVGVLAGGAAATYRSPVPGTLKWAAIVNYQSYDSHLESTGGASGDTINTSGVVPVSYNTQDGRDNIAISLGRVDSTIVIIVDAIRPSPRTQH